MSVTYSSKGPLTLSGLIGLIEKIQGERKSDKVINIDADTTSGPVRAMNGVEVRPPEHELHITVAGGPCE